MIRYLSSVPHTSARPALFLDRDGVLNRRILGGYVKCPADLELIDLALGAALAAQTAGAAIVVITNQGVVGRNLASEADLMAIHAHMLEALDEQGIHIDGIYACPHHPLALDPALRRCECRKPMPGLLLAASRDLNLDLSRSAMVGDQESDIMAARAAGIPADRALLVQSGSQRKGERLSSQLRWEPNEGAPG